MVVVVVVWVMGVTEVKGVKGVTRVNRTDCSKAVETEMFDSSWAASAAAGDSDPVYIGEREGGFGRWCLICLPVIEIEGDFGGEWGDYDECSNEGDELHSNEEVRVKLHLNLH